MGLLQDGKIKELQHTIEIRKGNLTSLLTDLDNKNKEVEDMKKYVEEMREHAEKAEKIAAELRKEKKMKNEKTGTQMSTPVAKPEKPMTLLAELEKPTQESMIEEGGSDLSYSFLSAEEGACADLDSTSCKFKKPEPRTKRKIERKKSSKDRRECSSEDSSQSEDRKRDRHGRRKNSETSQSEDKEMLDSMKNELKSLKKKHEKELKEIKEELE